MTKILVIGATGYVGKLLCTHLIRSGNCTVYGLARTPAKARDLARAEIVPCLCPDPIDAPQSYLELIHTARIDVVVDVAGANSGSHKILNTIVEAGEARAAADNANGVIHARKLAYVYTSGTWLHGNSKQPCSDLDVGPSGPVPALVQWRLGMEQAVLAAREVLDVLIIRPALVYGYDGAIWSALFGPIVAAKGSGASIATVPADPDATVSLVHAEDVASGIGAAISKIEMLTGAGVYPVFDLATSYESLRDLLEGFGEAVAFAGKIQFKVPQKDIPEDMLPYALSTSSNCTSSRAKEILAWQPKRVGMLASMGTCSAAWVAANFE